jgi:hypothetical protein
MTILPNAKLRGNKKKMVHLVVIYLYPHLICGNLLLLKVAGFIKKR